MSSGALGRVGWIGVGRMGAAMVRRLLAAEVPVTVWNRTAAKADPALRHAIDHLHVGHDRSLEGRAVILHARVFLRRAGRVELPEAG